MKLLNLDDLAAVKRSITFQGVSYEVVDESVGTMIESVLVAEKAKAKEAGEASETETVDLLQQMIRYAQSAIPSCPESVFRSMTMRQLRAVLEFINATDEEVVAGAEGEQEGEASGK